MSLAEFGNTFEESRSWYALCACFILSANFFGHNFTKTDLQKKILFEPKTCLKIISDPMENLKDNLSIALLRLTCFQGLLAGLRTHGTIIFDHYIVEGAHQVFFLDLKGQ